MVKRVKVLTMLLDVFLFIRVPLYLKIKGKLSGFQKMDNRTIVTAVFEAFIPIPDMLVREGDLKFLFGREAQPSRSCRLRNIHDFDSLV